VKKAFQKVVFCLLRRTESRSHFLEQIGGIMDNRIYGYARVSTREQNEDRQLETLIAFVNKKLSHSANKKVSQF